LAQPSIFFFVSASGDSRLNSLQFDISVARVYKTDRVGLPYLEMIVIRSRAMLAPKPRYPFSELYLSMDSGDITRLIKDACAKLSSLMGALVHICAVSHGLTNN